jgi:hypothetical protein
MRTVFRDLAVNPHTRAMFPNQPNSSHKIYYLMTLSDDGLTVKTAAVAGLNLRRLRRKAEVGARVPLGRLRPSGTQQWLTDAAD